MERKWIKSKFWNMVRWYKVQQRKDQNHSLKWSMVLLLYFYT